MSIKDYSDLSYIQGELLGMANACNDFKEIDIQKVASELREIAVKIAAIRERIEVEVGD